MKNYSLIVSVPDSEPTLYEMRGDRVGLGRELDNQIRLKMDEVSSSHCEFRKLEGGGYEVVDLDSTNGTRVNGKQVERQALADGDRLLVGEIVSVHFVELAEGEKPVDVAVEAGEGGKQAAAAYTQMDEKLQSIEADIAVKAGELEAMQEEYVAKQSEYEKMAASLKELETQIEEKKAQSGADSEEVRRMEMDLMTQTRRVQVMRTDLDGQAEQLQVLQAGAPAALTPAAAAAQRAIPVPIIPVPMSASPHAKSTQAPPQAQTPVQPVAQTPAQPFVAPPQPPQPIQPVAQIPQATAAPPAPAQAPVQAASLANPLVPPPVASGPKTTLLTPGTVAGASKSKRLLVDAPAKSNTKLNFDDGQGENQR